VDLLEDLCAVVQEALCVVVLHVMSLWRVEVQVALCEVDQWDLHGVCPCEVVVAAALREAVVPKEGAVAVLREAAVPKEVVDNNEVVAKIMVEEEVKEDPNLHLGEVLQTLGNNREDLIDPNKLHGVDPKVVAMDMVDQIWAEVGIKDPLKICPGITMVVDDRVAGIKEADLEEA